MWFKGIEDRSTGEAIKQIDVIPWSAEQSNSCSQSRKNFQDGLFE